MMCTVCTVCTVWIVCTVWMVHMRQEPVIKYQSLYRDPSLYQMEILDNLGEANNVRQVTWTVVVLKVWVAEPVFNDNELIFGGLIGCRAVGAWILTVLKGQLRGH